MPTTNPTTGDRIISRPTTDAYRDNPIWDKWEKRKKAQKALNKLARDRLEKIEVNDGGT